MINFKQFLLLPGKTNLRHLILIAKQAGLLPANNNFFCSSAFLLNMFYMYQVTIILFLLTILAPLNAQISLETLYQSGSDSGIMADHDKIVFDDTVSLKKYLHDLITELHRRNYLEASIDSLIYTPGKAIAYIHAGHRYNMVHVSFDNIDKQILRTLNVRTGRYEMNAVKISDFRELQDKFMTFYENSGYPFVTSSLSDLEINQDTIRGQLLIEKNRLYNFDSIYIYGDVSVGRNYIYRLIGIHPGDIYSEEKFKNAGQFVKETAFLTEMRTAEVEFRNEAADLYLYLNRRPASQFSGIVGIMPGGKDQKTRLAGELNLNLMNVFSRMEYISLLWQSPGNQIQQVDLGLGQPYFLGKAFGLDLNLNIYRQDSTYIKVTAEAGVPFSLPGRGTVRVFGRTTGTSPIAGPGHGVRSGAPAAQVSGQIFGFSYYNNKIDSRLNPYRGWMIKTSLGAGNKKVTPPQDFSGYDEEIKTGSGEGILQMELFIPVTAVSTILLNNLSGFKLNIGGKREQDYFFSNELFLLGGLHTIRGFDERSLAASSYMIQRIEYRYLFNSAGNIFLFFDGMAYREKLPGSDISDMPFGFGGGLTFETRAGQFSISYAVGRQLDNPLSLRSAKIHMGIINRF